MQIVAILYKNSNPGTMKKIPRFIVLLSVSLALFALQSCQQQNKDNKVKSEIDLKVDSLLSRMTLEEKIGQMSQFTLDMIIDDKTNKYGQDVQLDSAKLYTILVKYKAGSILNVAKHAYSRQTWLQIISQIQDVAVNHTRLGIPVIYGIDAIHGVNYTVGATLFPQQIAQAATWNPDLVKQIASITAYETRASGIPWNFSPVLGLGRQPVWPRFWETYGEDVYLAKQYTAAAIQGYQGDDPSDPYKVAACMKHYLGYSFPLSGRDRTPAWIPHRFLLEYFAPTFQTAVDNGVLTAMVNSGEINGIPTHADKNILTGLLRDQMHFDGMVVTDWEDIIRLHTVHHVAKDVREATKMAIDAGIDMSMIPFDTTFMSIVKDLVQSGEISETRIDQSVRRILKLKYELGLFDNPVPQADDYPLFGSPQFDSVSLQAAREAITLLKNKDNILPLHSDARILVTGPAANSMRYLNGGWTYTWQGQLTDSVQADRLTILEAMQEKFPNVTYQPGCTYDSILDIDAAVQAARQSDVILLCLGEASYTEKPGDIPDLYLPDAQTELALKLAATGKPVILVLVEGRPRLISRFADKMTAIVQTYLPGPNGGKALAEIIAGEVNPSGKLPYTYPRYPNALIPYDHKYSEEVPYHFGKKTFDPQFTFGYGLSYTTFEYSNLTISQESYSLSDTIKISVDVENTGDRAGKEVVQLYIGDVYASITPPVKRLRGFKKIYLKPGEKQTVTFKILPSELAFVGQNDQWIVEPGQFIVTVDTLKAKFNLK